jgi:hypothetical protein
VSLLWGEDKQNKDTGNLDYTRYRVKTNKAKILATLITQDMCNQGCQCLCFVCLHPVSCVIKVASVNKIQGEDKQNK